MSSSVFLLYFCLFLSFIPSSSSGGDSSAQPPLFKLLAESAGGWDIEYVPGSKSLTSITIEGEEYFRFLDPSPAALSGTPQLPSDALTLGIPFGSILNIELLNPEYESLEKYAVAPQPSYEFSVEHEAVELFRKNDAAYSFDRFLPSTQITVEPPFALRQQYISVIRIHPYQSNASRNTLRKLVKATLRIRLQGDDALRAIDPRSRASSDPQFEETYKSLLWNYEQAKTWRSTPSHRATIVIDSTRDWFETGKYYCKALVAKDGWYRITRAEIETAGGNLFGVDPASFKVLARGRQIPSIVRSDTSIEFYAYRHYGDSSYSDFYTDTSAYWLTWGGSEGLHFTAASVSGVPTNAIPSALQTLHVEQNLSYFAGSTDKENIDINTVAGEGWYWRTFSNDQQADLPFTLDSIDVSVTTAAITARVWGTGYVAPPGTPAQHQARFWVNDSLVGDVLFAQRLGGTLNVSIPASWLKVGINTLRVKNINTGTNGNSFYLDWFEVDYQRTLRATSDQLFFVSPGSSGGNPWQFSARGFTNSEIEVFNLSNHREITDGIVSGDSFSGYSIAFQDTFSSSQMYVVVAAGSQRTVPPLRQKMFSDIRVLAQGADYLVVSHKNFLSQANQLATHRQSANNVRTKVVDVEDIYDEFNYGAMNAVAMKTFLNYAYTNWTAPSLSNVVFFGDACWDYHRYYSNTVKTNYVPAYGFPGADNWFGCFNPAVPFIPSLYIGRIPVENTTQAQSVVNKIIGYDTTPVENWSKNFLFITGGNDLSEQANFNYLAESAIASYVKPAPFGATPFRVYKSTAGYVDGEHKQEIKNLIRDGLSFLSFTGHSGGRIWGVDPGPVSEFENTNGKLPFVSSVSCNVGGFASPANSVFAEDLLLADNRGAIGAWATSAVGFATYGAALTNYWLANATADSVREFGKLTTNARYRLWFETGSGYITIAMVNLNPLVGDPMSKLAVPRKPDLAISPFDISLSKALPTLNDSLTIGVKVHNFGLVPSDSVGITLTDIHNGQTTYLLSNKKLPKTFHIDSVFVKWNATSQVGLHSLVATVDPLNAVDEANELNNTASSDKIIYTNNVFVLKPLNNMVVPEGVQRLVVTSPIGYDSSGFVYQFELDTVDTFDSPVFVASGSIVPGSVTGEWMTPSLQSERVYFWRSRTMHGSLAGNWVVSSFATSQDLPATATALAPRVRWRENMKKQFNRDVLTKAAATDSGVTIRPLVPISLYCRSVGNLYDQNRDYYGVIMTNDQLGSGYWWPIGASFVAARINDFTGVMDYRPFALYPAYIAVNAGPWQADSLANFINNSPVGSYIAVAVIFNGQTNVNEHLRQAMDTLGATLFRSIVNGQKYAFIGRKGNGSPGMTPLEQLRTNDSCVVSLTIPSYYGDASGSITSSGIPIAASWDSLHWRRSGDFTRTNATVALLGRRTTGGIDTLRVFPKDSTDINLASLTSQTAGPRYSSLAIAGMLSTTDATATPSLSDWWIDFSPPPDLAVSARTIGTTQNTTLRTFNLPITVHNIGYAKSDSARVVVYALDKYNRSKQVATALFDSIDIDGNRSMMVTFSTTGLPAKTRLQVVVGSTRKGRDLNAENNTAWYTLHLENVSVVDDMRVYVDGTEAMDGDYISSTPKIVVRPSRNEQETFGVERMDVLVDNKPISSATSLAFPKAGNINSSEHQFAPTLEDGHHEITFRLGTVNVFGEVDSTQHTLSVNVLGEARILRLSNYPNPFASDTYFTFTLTARTPSDALTIRVFTVAGRRIKEISVPGSALQTGFNRVYWDGRDSEGDEIANGYYFYQVSFHSSGKSISSIEKLVKTK